MAASCSRRRRGCTCRRRPIARIAGGAPRPARAPLVIVHGGGKEIDAALKTAGIEKRQVDGLRVTDDATLDVVVAVLAGTVNTRLVAALTTAGVAAVGLTGADGRCGLSKRAPPHRGVDGRTVDLGRVGDSCRSGPTSALLTTLVANGFTPVVASIGVGRDGRLFNVNADTFAGHLAARLSARRLVIAGTTAGVLDHAGATVPVIEPATMERLIASGTATAGMIAKLRACEHALAGGVDDVVIVDGGNRAALEAAALGDGTEIQARLDRVRPGSCATSANNRARWHNEREAQGLLSCPTVMQTTIDDVQTRESRHVLQTYRRQPVTFVRGEGVRLFDADGTEYLDLLSGIGVASLGHAHPGLARAIADQAQTLLHTSNLFYHPLQGQLAERLAHLSGLPRAFFCNSGTEAVEACLKFARRYWYTRGEPRSEFIALNDSFHGRTFGSLSVTSDEHYRKPFEPLLPSVRFVPVNEPMALRAAVSRATAAIIAEPVQGEGGIQPLTPAFAEAIIEASAKTGALVIADEVQSGLGRTGYPFYFAALGLKPHLVSVGKALGGGVPVAAALVSQEVADTIAFGDHGTTYGGNLLACRAALCVLDQLVGGGLLAHVGRVGAPHFEQRLQSPWRRKASDDQGSARGAGLIWGLELTRDAAPVIAGGARTASCIVNRTAETVVRLCCPPLVITAIGNPKARSARLDACARRAVEPRMRLRTRITLALRQAAVVRGTQGCTR